jgi:SAM-dependent methyltransferase
MTTQTDDLVHTAVREQYAKAATIPGAGCGPGCCAPGPQHSLELGYSREELAAVPEGADLGLGCGNPQAIAALRAGETVLDLGSGGGFDCFLAARQVGSAGRVIGVDMTPEMIVRARDNARRITADNVEFRLGEIEHLPVEDATVDVILSNCVVNLSPDKPAVFREAMRVLKPGGRLAISDIVQTGTMPEELRENIAALTGCISGATPLAEIEDMLRTAGFVDVRVRVRPDSGSIIGACFPDFDLAGVVASATIEARKAGTASCCEPSCCGG